MRALSSAMGRNDSPRSRRVPRYPWKNVPHFLHSYGTWNPTARGWSHVRKQRIQLRCWKRADIREGGPGAEGRHCPAHPAGHSRDQTLRSLEDGAVSALSAPGPGQLGGRLSTCLAIFHKPVSVLREALPTFPGTIRQTWVSSLLGGSGASALSRLGSLAPSP